MNRIVFVLSVFFLAGTTVFGQSVKVKGDLVLVDKVPAFQFLKIEDSERASWEVRSLDGDLLISFIGKTISLPQLRHESTPLRYYYYQVDFAKSGKTAYRIYQTISFRKSLAQAILEGGLFEDDQYKPENEEAFIERYCKYQDRVAELEKAVERREKLKTDEEYQNYLSTLVVRSASFPVDLNTPGKIIVNQVEIGTYRMEEAKLGTSYFLFTKPGDSVGSIFYEYEKNRVFIRSTADNAGKEYFIEGPFDANRFKEAILYLLDNAYL